MCEPLKRLTHNDIEWKWTMEQDNAFTAIKQAITTTPVLKYFDPTKPVEGQGDASSTGL